MSAKRKSAIQEIAEQEGSEEKVIQKSIESVWDDINQKPGSLYWLYWQSIQKKGLRPTAEEMINHVVTFYNVYQLVLMEKGKKLSDVQRGKVLDMSMGLADMDKVGEAAMRAMIFMQEEGAKEKQNWRKLKN